MIALDDATISAWSDRPMAFWGDRYAKIIQNAREFGAIEVAFDIVPAMTNDQEYLQAVMGRALEQARDKVGGKVLDDADIDAILNAPDAPELKPDSAWGNAITVADGRVVLANDLKGTPLVPELMDLSVPLRPYVGFADMQEQPDDACRIASLFARARAYHASEAVCPSFCALVAARTAEDIAGNRSSCRPDRAADLLALANGAASEEIRKGVGLDTFWLNPPGRPGELPPIISASTLADNPGDRERSLLQGATVVVGTAFLRGDSDVYRAPGGVSTNVPGVVFQAYAISTLLDHSELTRLSWWREGLMSAAIVLLWIFLMRAARLTFVPGLASAVSIAVAWATVSYLSFAYANLLLPAAVPFVFVLSTALVTYGIASVEERTARRYVEAVFGRNVSPAIRDYLVHHDTAALEQGASTIASVLFFDVRGSTAFAENREPEEVIAELNRMFDWIVPIVEEQGGLINRYTGDGFLALFGVVQPLPDHARAAAETAIRIADALNGAGSRLPQPGNRPDATVEAPLRLSGGCGVHTGPVVYGYLGARDRAEFSVIGDTANVAARLESLNKPLGTLAVFSDTTVSQLPDSLKSRLAGPFEREISGRQAKMTIFTIPVPTFQLDDTADVTHVTSAIVTPDVK